MHSDSSDADSDHCTRPIVMHMGSSRIRAGFAGDDCPDVYSDTVCTTDPTRGILCGTRARCSKESLRHPIDAGGFVGNWEDIEALWRDTFERDMRVAAEDHQVMLVDAPGWTWEQREKYAELMYETFRVPGFAMHGEAALALCCSGRTTGVVIDVGTHITHISCVHDGVIAESRNVRTGGEDVTNRLQALLAERGVVLDSSAARGAKEAVCRIAGVCGRWLGRRNHFLKKAVEKNIQKSSEKGPPRFLHLCGLGIFFLCFSWKVYENHSAFFSPITAVPKHTAGCRTAYVT